MNNLMKFFYVGVACSLLVACQGNNVEPEEVDTMVNTEEEIISEEVVDADFKDHSRHIQFTLERFFKEEAFIEETYYAEIGFGEPASYTAYVSGTVPTRYDLTDLESALKSLNLNARVLVFFDDCQITFDPEYNTAEINFFYDLDDSNCIEYHLDQPYDSGTDLLSYKVFCIPSWIHEEYEFTYLVFNDGNSILLRNTYGGEAFFNPTEEDFESVGAILF